MYKLMKLLPPFLREYILLARGRLKNGYKKTAEDIKRKGQRDNADFYYSPKDKSTWEKAFLRLCTATDIRGKQLADEFYSNPLDIVNENFSAKSKGIVLICAVKNELENMKKIYSHYASLGVKKFAFIDNMSSDGFVEYFTALPDVNIYQAGKEYSSIRRQAWINKVMAKYGFDRWYIIIDSDEYLDYNCADIYSVDKLVKHYEDNKITRAKALLLDMYPSEISFDNSSPDFISEYKYFDVKGYSQLKPKDLLLIDGLQGGVRGRIFSADKTANKPWLTKYPLIYLERGDIQFQSHMSYPFYKNFKSKNNLVLKHYKFMPSDLDKYSQRAKNGNFSDASKEYKQYVKIMEQGKIDFFDINFSHEYVNHDSFYAIKQMVKIDW